MAYRSLTRPSVLACTALLAALSLSACGSGGGGTKVASAGGGSGNGSAKPTATASLNPAQARLAFTKCMRDHGVEMPDQNPGGGLSIQMPSDADGQAKMTKALAACKSLDSAQQGNANDPAQQKKALDEAKCLRAHGVDMPDPQPGTAQQMPQGPNVDAAMKACGMTFSGTGQ
ncbi:hypothetical protein [Streptacidiphilus sp. PAMC 29251]